MSDLSGSMLQSLFDAALRDYEKQTGMKLIEHPLARRLENCNSVESITAILQEQARAFTEFRRDDDKVMKPLKHVVHVLHAISTNLSFPHAKTISAAFAILLRSIKDVGASYDALVDILESIKHFLSRLDIYVKFPPASPTAAMGEIIVKIMVELLSTIALVTKQIKQKRPLKLIKKLWGGKEVEAVLQRLDRLTQDEARTTAAQTLEVVYGLVQNMRVVMDDGKVSADGIRDALEIMQDIASKINKSEREKLLRDARKWLGPPDPWINHNYARKLHHKGTSTWFVQGNSFSEWKLSGPNSLLWIHGKPGGGKSVLCSTIIEDIDHMRKRGLASLAFFYCDFRDDDKKNLRGLLSSLLVQFCHSSDTYSAILSDFYSEHDNGSRQPCENALIGCLKLMLEHPGQAPVYIIIDALDECPNTFGLPTPREEVLELVEGLVDLHLANLHICVTSRPEADIRDCLDPLPFKQISLHTENGQVQDIVNYIKFVVQKMKRWTAADKGQVVEVLTNKGDGMFRWVFCQFEVLRHCLPQRVRHVLGELPKSLDGTYERILQDINEENWKFALRLFQCVAVASRPLRVDELAEFLAFDFDAGPAPTFLAGWRPEDPIGAVLSTCSSLLAVVDVQDLTFIQFSHFSVREFLTSTRLAGANDNISRYHVSMTPAHTIITRACLGILLHLDEEVTNDSLKSFPLAEYAAKNWVDHARFDSGSRNTQAAMKHLFDPRRPHLRILVWIYDPEIPWWIRSERLSQPRGTCLHYATLSGFPDLVKFLVTEFSLDLNARGFFDDVTPLHLASRDGHVGVARVLLEHGAKVNVRDISKWTPLRHALDKGHIEVAQVLIENGADVGTQGVDDWMPLHWATRHGQAELVRVLLEHGADMYAKDVYGWTPWGRASDEGHVEVTQVLFQHNIAASSQSKSTPLHAAAGGGDVEFVRTLLKYGADARVQDQNNTTPLHMASEVGHMKVALVLLEHGADTRTQDKDKSTPLHLASRGGHVGVALVLLEHGADIRTQDKDKSTPLHLASRGGHMEVALVLLERGAYMDAKDIYGWTPLHRAFFKGHVKLFRRLVQHSLASSSQTNSKSIALHEASGCGDVKFVRALLKYGADARAQDINKWTPLHWASEGGHMEVASMLPKHGADISAQDKHKSTPLHLASRGGHVGVAQVLLEHGADVDAKDIYGWTPWRWAFSEGHVEVIQVLVRHNLAASSPNNNKSTALHEASGSGDVEFARALLKYGTDARAQDINKRTPLHWASEGGHMEVASMLLKYGADISTQDKDKSTPLHLASRGGRVGVALVLLEHGADVDANDVYGWTPWRCAFANGHVAVIRVLVQYSLAETSQNNSKIPALHEASGNGDVEFVQILLEYGAHAGAQDMNNWTPIHWASVCGHTEVALVLLEHGADISIQDRNKSTPLHLASRGGHVEIARALLKYGADASTQDRKRLTPLHLALRCSCHIGLLRTSSCKHLEVARVLLTHGADVNAEDEDKSTLLHWASQGGHVKVALLLLEHGADASAEDEDKLTPLHWASQGGHLEAALLLLKHGVDASARDEDWSTPLHRASQGGHLEVTRALLKYGADASAQDEGKLTPLNLALRCSCQLESLRASSCEHREVARVLLGHGGDRNDSQESLKSLDDSG